MRLTLVVPYAAMLEGRLMTAASRRSASPLPTLATWALWLLGALLLVFVVAVPMDVTQ